MKRSFENAVVNSVQSFLQVYKYDSREMPLVEIEIFLGTHKWKAQYRVKLPEAQLVWVKEFILSEICKCLIKDDFFN